MTVHKLTAGDGYAYLSRQVAAQDATSPGPDGLAAYYTAKGESPGRWMGRGTGSLDGEIVGTEVTQAQMEALFGEGRHPNRHLVERALADAGAPPAVVDKASRLGEPYRVFTAAGEFRRRCAIEFRELNVDRGDDRAAPVPPQDRAHIRTAVAIDMFREMFGRTPLNPRELSGHLARISRQTTTAVAGYDLTFSPVKSVSTLWAIAPRDIAEVIEQAHADAVRDVVTWLEDHATFTRTGRRAVAQVDVRGVLAAAFTHRDSRAGDPDLHTHVAISNKVQTISGRWLALDGRPIFANTVAASERYNTRIEALLVARLGVRFADRQDGTPGKRAVREIIGIDGPLPRHWSSRRAAIDARRAVLSAAFHADHGRPPTAREAVHLAQRANLETREAKHEPRSHAQQRATWRAEALSLLGGEEQIGRYVQVALHPGPHTPRPDVGDGWLDAAARSAVHRVGHTRATWNEALLRAEAERRARRAGVPAPDLDTTVDAIVVRALSPAHSIRLSPDRDQGEPAALRRRDGASVFEVAGSAVYTSAAVLDAERVVLEAAGRSDGHVTPADVVTAALAAASASGPALNAGQAEFVRVLATSGARVQVALSPAGTGKTTALRTLAAAWRAGGGSVIGLAPSAAASSVLREQLADNTDTVAKFVHAARTGVDVPAWLTSLGPASLVVVDEAGAATTHDLAQVVAAVVAAGGSVRLIGDDQQLGPVGAGGLLSDLAETYGAAQLSEVVRFTDANTGAPNVVEGAVSLALRDGDPTSLAYYADRGRLHVGDLSSCADQAYAAWSADRDEGRDALMLAPTRELVRDLNVRARSDRLRREGASRRDIVLADGTTASAGDVVISRRNDRTIASGAAAWVTNGDRWTVAAVRASGAVDVVHTRTAALVTLPPAYVRTHLELGYATTVHSAQGVTTDSSYTVVAGNESRQLLYVALTRGRHSNHAFVTVTADGDAHSTITRDGVLPPTAVEVLERVLARDTAPQSASSVAADESDSVLQLSSDVDRYVHALATAAEDVVGAERLARIDLAADAFVPDLTAQPAYPTLRADLALHAAAGSDPVAVLRDALANPLGTESTRDTAAVLDWRISAPAPDGAPAPLDWLPAVPAVIEDDPGWGDYLGFRAGRIRDLAMQVADASSSWTPESAPTWARPLLADRGLVCDLAVWRAATGCDPSDPRPVGAPCRTAAEAEEQAHFEQRVRRVVRTATTDAVRWSALLKNAAPDVIADPFWPVVLDRLVDRRMSDSYGVDLLLAATTRPLPDELPAAALWWRLLEHLPVSAVPAEVASDQQPALPDHTVPGSIEHPPDPEPSGGPTDVRPAPSRERVLDLNQQAAAFFADAYTGSWAQEYVIDRLGCDPAGTTAHVIGLAPRSWTALVDHLRSGGATDTDLVAAGLATTASNGRLIDRFRDRVVFAIRDDDGIVGWIGRRHPDADTRPHPAAPKYLNTPETVAFTKGRQLFGLSDNRTALGEGATPVIVEGPLDALAVTIAGAGQFVGVAPLGTAFTAEQASEMLALVPHDRPGPIVGMDADRAGWRSAESIFWQLGPSADTRCLVMPEGLDPAALAQADGGHALLAALNVHVRLADVLVNRRIDALVDRLDTVEGQVAATRHAAQVIAAVPVHRWPRLLTQVVARTGIDPEIALAEVLTAADSRDAVPQPRRNSHPYGQRRTQPADGKRSLTAIGDARSCWSNLTGDRAGPRR